MADLAKERVSYKKNIQATAAKRSICLSLLCLSVWAYCVCLSEPIVSVCLSLLCLSVWAYCVCLSEPTVSHCTKEIGVKAASSLTNCIQDITKNDVPIIFKGNVFSFE